MEPEVLNLVIMGIEFVVNEEPTVAAELKAIFSKPNPTPDDWKAMRAAVLAKSYEQLVPNSALNTAPPAPAA